MQKIWKGLGGDHEELLSIETFGGHKTEVQEIIEEMERLALSNIVKGEKHLICGGLREALGMKTYLHGPMDYSYAKKLKTAISCRGPGPTRKKNEIYQ